MSWMFRVMSNHEDAKKCAPKKGDHKKKPDVQKGLHNLPVSPFEAQIHM